MIKYFNFYQKFLQNKHVTYTHKSHVIVRHLDVDTSDVQSHLTSDQLTTHDVICHIHDVIVT